MKLGNELPVILGSAFFASAIVITQPQIAAALSGEEVNNIAREVTVLVNGINPGSGVIIAKDSSTYYVLTANHVVKTQDEYQIITHDKQAYKIDYKKIKHFSGLDLALVEFSSKKDYKVATLANSDLATEGKTIYISGWPNPGQNITERIRQFTTGQISSRPQKPLADGYGVVYTNVTRAGMSGGPVFDTMGRVIAIHGRGEGEVISNEEKQKLQESGAGNILATASKVGFNLGIPINSFLSKAPQQGIYLGLKVENSPPQESKEKYVASNQVDARDKMDIKDVLNTINDTVKTIENIRRILPF
ncbi:S1 family peptidase [Fortiea contorta]|uniref:S1 family peptidase n=1 Tax=Fortiea contorta TaxID=1892405 RepID=UPI0003482225|nr:serine protease [Fortiea contorta]